MTTRPLTGLLRRLGASASHEALVGDIVEEIGAGRSRVWICEQLFAVCALVLMAHARARLRLTPYLVAFALGTVMLASIAVLPARNVLVTWLMFYYFAGMISLFAHMASQTQPPTHEDTKLN